MFLHGSHTMVCMKIYIQVTSYTCRQYNDVTITLGNPFFDPQDVIMVVVVEVECAGCVLHGSDGEPIHRWATAAPG